MQSVHSRTFPPAPDNEPLPSLRRSGLHRPVSSLLCFVRKLNTVGDFLFLKSAISSVPSDVSLSLSLPVTLHFTAIRSSRREAPVYKLER
ncbi:hypothetical protein VZT92_024772 [Zoarces viviparus]|uniref:Uncharacterized protein n=1 Tax=Zoarces viviparus TaxID=48416 RepID=A0AAW1E3S8_ZOAVI